jgi:cytochrome c5
MKVLRLAAAVGPLLLCTAQAQNLKTTLDGVYSNTQAARGEALYRANCARCHGDELQGRVDPSLKGDAFIDRWREDALNSLYTHARTRMPPRLAGAVPPGGLKDGDYLDLVAFILRENGFPSGSSELTAASVTGIQFVGKDGPRSLPTNAQAVIVGCLMAGPANAWVLTDATEPLRTRTPEESTPEELQYSASRPLGTLTFRLRNVPDFRPGFSPDPWKGHRVQVKGVLIRQTNNDRITVLSMESAAESCTP